MISLRIARSLVLVFLVAASGPVAADDAPDGQRSSAPVGECSKGAASAVTAKVQSRYDAIDDFAAHFEQETESVMLTLESLEAGDEKTEGQVVFAKPGRMRWAYSKPAESYVISNGEVIWLYDVTDRQATRLAVTEGFLAGAALQFLLGEGDLAKSFVVQATRCTGESTELDLLPRETAGYERLGLIVDPGTGLVQETSIVDLFGNRTRIRFRDIRLDQSPAASTFEFTPPDGVEVIELSPRS